MEEKAQVILVDDATFENEVLRSEVPVLVDFTATWCGPCRALAPIVERVARENAGRVKVVKMDTDESPGTTRQYGVRGVPTLMVFRGGEKKAAHVGLAAKETVLALIERSASGSPPDTARTQVGQPLS
jgi:thioredoxin 1